MEQAVILNSTPRTDAEYEAAIDRYLVAMQHLVTEMTVTRRQIEKDRAETEATLARLEALV